MVLGPAWPSVDLHYDAHLRQNQTLALRVATHAIFVREIIPSLGPTRHYALLVSQAYQQFSGIILGSL